MIEWTFVNNGGPVIGAVNKLNTYIIRISMTKFFLNYKNRRGRCMPIWSNVGVFSTLEDAKAAAELLV